MEATTTARELADLLVASFDATKAMRLERALADLLRARGVGRFEADEMAYRRAEAVLRELQARPKEQVPFRFGRSDEYRLVGKERVVERDTPETAFTKRVWRLAGPLLDYLVTVAADDFEVVAAAAVGLAGGEEMRALCTGDEGGIDFYGRLAIRPPSQRIDTGILYTTIIPTRLLVLGQAKRYARDAKIGRPEIQKFKGQIDDCLEQYRENPCLPAHRIPSSFYKRGEPCLGIFVTTASFTETAAGAVTASGVVLVPGVTLAQYLVMHGVGVVQGGGAPAFRADAFTAWLEAERGRLVDGAP